MSHSAARRLGAASLFAVAIAALTTAGDASAEIKKLMSTCPGQTLCAWFQSPVTPPKGWVEDKDAGAKRTKLEVEARRVQILEKSSSSGASGGAEPETPAGADIEEVPF